MKTNGTYIYESMAPIRTGVDNIRDKLPHSFLAPNIANQHRDMHSRYLLDYSLPPIACVANVGHHSTVGTNGMPGFVLNP
jgi:hypothetical protein